MSIYNETTKHALRYETCVPRRRRTVFLKATTIALLGAVVFLCTLKHEAIEERIRYRQIQRYCQNWAPAPGLVVYDNDATDENRLATDPRYVRVRGGVDDADQSPEPWPKWSSAVGLSSLQWMPLTRHKFSSIETIAFSHAMRTPSGTDRLVIIPFTKFQARTWRAIDFHALTLKPVSAWGKPSAQVIAESANAWTILLSPLDHLKVLPGTVDPSNHSHFVLRYKLNGAAHAIDGWLKDDGSLVLTEHKNGGERNGRACAGRSR
jgi:hypothetical protein